VVIAPLLATLLLGVFWKRATGCGAFAGLIAGAAAALLHHGLALPRGETRGIHGGWIAVLHRPASDLRLSAGTIVIAFVVSLLVTAIVSAFTKPRENAPAVEMIPLKVRSETADTAWWKRPEWLAIAILLAAAAVCAVFA
jgi:solute:Na+ symporter, SSS family